MLEDIRGSGGHARLKKCKIETRKCQPFSALSGTELKNLGNKNAAKNCFIIGFGQFIDDLVGVKIASKLA